MRACAVVYCLDLSVLALSVLFSYWKNVPMRFWLVEQHVKSCKNYAIITLELMILSNAFEQFDTIKLFKLCMIFKLCFLKVFAEQAEIV